MHLKKLILLVDKRIVENIHVCSELFSCIKKIFSDVTKIEAFIPSKGLILYNISLAVAIEHLDSKAVN